jgi:hypothetical protein
MRLGMILDTMQKCMSKDRIESNMQELDKYRGMYPILKWEQMNAQFMYDAMVGNKIKDFDLIEFKEGQKPNLAEILAAGQAKNNGGGVAASTDEPFLGKKAAEAPASKRPFDEEEEKKPVVDEEAKKKARDEMRKKLMLPDTVTSKLKGIGDGKLPEKKKPEVPKLLLGKKEELGL